MKGKAIITSALPYANGEIHLGHVASTYLPADVLSRYLRQKGIDCYYICASDDFGTPILIQAEKQGKLPKDYVEYWNKRDSEDFELLDIRFDFFYKTSSVENIEFVQGVFDKLKQKSYVYKKEIVQFFCIYDQKFLPDRYIKGMCPYCKAEDQYSDICEKCGRVPESIENPRCAICGREPTKKSTEHYFFKLSSFTTKLYDWIQSNENLQKDVKNYVLNWIEEGLEDWDITRDITWGVPVPDSSEKDMVFYGWFDNHLAYISSALKYLKENGHNGKKFWNSATIYHFIGKDIVYHHYLFLPAIRMGLGEEYKLPDFMPTRGHLTLQSKKISKSRNWYIGLREFLEVFPADYLRFYLELITPYSQDDLNFDWDDFAVRINTELIGNIGNFVNRALSFTLKKFEGIVPEPTKDFDTEDRKTMHKIREAVSEIATQLDYNHVDRALKKILEVSAHFNQYFQKKEPWKKEPHDAENNGNAKNCIFISCNAVYALAVLLNPFIPATAKKIWSQLNLSGYPSDQDWHDLIDNEGLSYIKAGHKISSDISPLFSKVEQETIEKRKAKLG